MAPPARSTLETERLVRRPFEPSDLDALAPIDADRAVTEHLLRGPAGRAASTARLEGHIAHFAEHGFGIWAVVSNECGALIGECGLRILDGCGDIELHYVLARPQWGKGLATEAAAAALRHGFETLALDRVVAFALPTNAPSLRVMEKLGMAFERNGTFGDTAVIYYAITRAAYLARK